MSRAQVFGWLLLLLVCALNAVAIEVARPRLAVMVVLLLAVPSFTGFSLAQMGVRLLGGGS